MKDIQCATILLSSMLELNKIHDWILVLGIIIIDLIKFYIRTGDCKYRKFYLKI